MAYTPTTWHGGDVLSAEAMNKIEQGISDAENASNVFIIESSNNTLNKTYAEIKEAYISGKQCLIKYDDNNYYSITGLSLQDSTFEILSGVGGGIFSANTINDYPLFAQYQ